MRGSVERQTGCVGYKDDLGFDGVRTPARRPCAPSRLPVASEPRRLAGGHFRVVELAPAPSGLHVFDAVATVGESPLAGVTPATTKSGVIRIGGVPSTNVADGWAGRRLRSGHPTLAARSSQPRPGRPGCDPIALRPTVAGSLSLRSATAIRSPIATPATARQMTARQMTAIETRRHLAPTSERASSSQADRRARHGHRLDRRGVGLLIRPTRARARVRPGHEPARSGTPAGRWGLSIPGNQRRDRAVLRAECAARAGPPAIAAGGPRGLAPWPRWRHSAPPSPGCASRPRA